jgi:16S rRNA (guanine966-N2)-methyltransferase
MRIIAGELRGRRIQAPPGLETRPMLGRFRESLFAVLGERVAEARVLDLFSGSGSLAFEAASRGAASVRLVERSGGALAALRANVQALGLGASFQIVRGDAWKSATWGEGPYDLVFADPPFDLWRNHADRARSFAALEHLARDFVSRQGLIVLRAPASVLDETSFPPPLRVRERDYGRSSVWFIERIDPPAACSDAADSC